MKKGMSFGMSAMVRSKMLDLLKTYTTKNVETCYWSDTYAVYKSRVIEGIDIDPNKLQRGIKTCLSNPKSHIWDSAKIPTAYLRSALLSVCLDRDLPLTASDLHFISSNLNFKKFLLGGYFIYVDSPQARDLVHKLGFTAIYKADDCWTQPDACKTDEYCIYKHTRMSAKMSAASSKSKEELVSEAKAATLMYYSSVAREAQQTYMRKFNTLTGQ